MSLQRKVADKKVKPNHRALFLKKLAAKVLEKSCLVMVKRKTNAKEIYSNIGQGSYFSASQHHARAHK